LRMLFECWLQFRGEPFERRLAHPPWAHRTTSAAAGRVCVIRVGCRQGIECSMTTVSSADKPRSIVRPDRVHGSIYTDPAIFAEEMERIFSLSTGVFVGT